MSIAHLILTVSCKEDPRFVEEEIAAQMCFGGSQGYITADSWSQVSLV